MIQLKSTTRRTIFGGHYYPQTLSEIRGGISSGEVVWRGLEPLQILERLQTNGTPDSDFRILEYPLDLCDQSVKASISS